MKIKMNKISLRSKANLETAIKYLGKNNLQFLIVLNDKNKLIGTITDGDVRRALIKGYGMDTSISKIMNKKPKFSQANQSDKI